ncbi:hypothetical protein [Natrarchaeobius oligotrophus]|uniref:Uncharacterized protein n=1 Tax=Natrarchaeobius chitinivorans TaxID=1679083 RepID=A0A3N6M4V7_NATCH|nr:hypothetical protein [Natrarchaeobius chitinivorans]RQG98583.1 hypothetical protein EA472_17430 [Natrarchaeobius chitinivorans]
MYGVAASIPLFVGPTVFLLGLLIALVVAAAIVGLLFSLSWRVIAIGALVLGILWLVGVIEFTSGGPSASGLSTMGL